MLIENHIANCQLRTVRSHQQTARQIQTVVPALW